MVKLTETAEKVLKERYYLEGESKWEDLVHRVADCFADNDDEYHTFNYDMGEMNWLPNSPCLMNAGTSIKAYSACYVLPIEDNIDSIFKYYSDAGKISKSGGGVGATFTKLRAEGSNVSTTKGVSSGPLSFAKGQDALTEVIKQGGRRRGANMGILLHDHPDIYKWISAKDEKGVLENFNLSVGVTDEFMYRATDAEFAKEYALWQELTKRAHATAEPGILFMDAIERGNEVPHIGRLEATNPCSEQPLLPYESCSLASINLANHVSKDGIDWDKLEVSVHNVVLFMNRVLDKSEMPIPECQDAMELTKKIGIGFMGLHDVLIQLGIPYDSQEGCDIAGSIMEFISNECDFMSKELGARDGLYGGYKEGTSPKRRNAHLTTLAPTGTLSMVADCSSGCEPYYTCGTVYKTVLDDTTFAMHNPQVARLMAEHNMSSEDILNTFRTILKGAQDIHWRDHILMQASIQKHVDSSISKTINMPSDATVEDVREAYKLAWETGCKGATVYVDGSRGQAVLSTSKGDGGEHGDDNRAEPVLPCTKATIPDQLHAIRYKVKVRKESVYVIISENESGRPVEIFCKFPYAQDNDWDSLCRSISLSLRYGVPLSDVIRQLEKSVRVLNDTPSHLARILKEYLSEEAGGDGIICSDCGGKVIFEEGCERCLSCGVSKCS